MSPLHAQNLSRRIGGKLIIDDLSFSIAQGEKVIMLGSNGAGKTTLLRMFAGLAKPSKGELALGDSTFSYLSHSAQLYPHLSVQENLTLFSDIAGITEERLEEEIHTWNLETILRQRVETLSAGQRMRVALARTFLRTVDLYLLDEPSSNLDDAAAELLSMRIKDVECASLTATHDVRRLGRIAERFVLLHEGRIVADVSTKENEDARREVEQRYRELNR